MTRPLTGKSHAVPVTTPDRPLLPSADNRYTDTPSAPYVPVDAATLPLPRPRGPFTDHVVGYLTGIVADLPDAPLSLALDDGDLQRALWFLNVAQVGDHPAVLADRVRSLAARTLHWQLQDAFETAILDAVGRVTADDLQLHVDDLLSRTGVDLAATAADAGPEAMQSVLLAKAPYLGFEADPHTFALAALEPPVQRVVAEIQAGEYGMGHRQTHAQIYRSCLTALDVTFADAVASAPTASFVDANLTWLFGRDRRWRGASVGQLCLFELDSVGPCTRYAQAWDRVGLPEAGRRWFDVHVLADAEHELVVRQQLIPAIEDHAPWLVPDAAFGAEATWFVQQRVALELVERWS